MYCGKCGKQLPESSPFCAFCGEMLVPAAQNALIDKLSEERGEPQDAAEKSKRSEASRSKSRRILLVACFLCVAAIAIAELFIILRLTNDTNTASSEISQLAPDTEPLPSAIPISEPNGATPAPPVKIENTGYDTPEAAVADYLEGLKRLDFDRMLGAFAMESYVESFDFGAQLQRLGAYMPITAIKAPNVNEFVRTLNLESLRAQVTDIIIWQYFVLVMPDFMPFTKGTPYIIDDVNTDIDPLIEMLSDELGADKVRSIELIGFLNPQELSEVYGSEKNQENISRQAKTSGIDEIRSVVAMFSYEGREALLCCDVGLYGDKWRIVGLQGNIGNLLGLNTHLRGIVVAPAGESILDYLNSSDEPAPAAIPAAPAESAAPAPPAAPAQPISSLPEAIKELEDGILSVGLSIGWEPFEYYAEDGRTLTGIDVELMKVIGIKLGVDVEFIDIPFDKLLQGLNDGKYDVAISGISITAEREQVFLFSQPYYFATSEDEYGIAMRKESIELQQKIDRILADLTENRSLQRIIRDQTN